MFKKILKIIGSFFLVVILLFVAIAIWYLINSSKYEEVAKPFLEESMPIIATWDYEKLVPLLSPKGKEAFDTERGQKIYKMFSKLGQLESFDDPQFLSAKTGVSVGEDSYDIVIFSIPSYFENGKADIKITLDKNGDSFSILSININSDAFIE